MILIQFSGLSFKASAFEDNSFVEGFLKPGKDDIVPIRSQWDSETYDVQYIIYDTYNITMYLREYEYQSFQKIQYAPNVIIQRDEVPKVLNVKVIDFKEGKFINEFWQIDLTFKDLGSKQVENIILNTIETTFNIYDGTVIPFSANINVPVITGAEFKQVLADNFNDDIVDYNKNTNIKRIRFYVNGTDLISLYDKLRHVSLFSNYSILIDSIEYKQFEPKQEYIGNDLYEITMIIKALNTITVPETTENYEDAILYSDDSYLTYE